MDSYQPEDEFKKVSVRWPDVDPIERDLTAEEWGIYGEGPDMMWDAFRRMLNRGELGDVPARLRPDAPDWPEAMIPMARQKQKRRGNHLFAHVGASPETLFRVQGAVGAETYGVEAEVFATTLDPKVHDYVERFEAGDRPGRFHVWITPGGDLQGPQEGRHRAAAAMLAGLEWVPVVVLYETTGTFTRHPELQDGREARTRYPEGDA